MELKPCALFVPQFFHSDTCANCWQKHEPPAEPSPEPPRRFSTSMISRLTIENQCDHCGKDTYGRYCKACKSGKTQSDPCLNKTTSRVSVWHSCAECGIPFRLGFRGKLCTPCRLHKSHSLPEMNAIMNKPPTSDVLKIREKYMNPVPKALGCLVEYVNAAQSLPLWEQAIVDDLKTMVQKCLNEHLETNVLSRQRFQALSPEHWRDDNGMVRLTEAPRKVLGYLPKKGLSEADKLCHNFFKDCVMDYRLKLETLMQEVRASQADRIELTQLLARDSFLLADVEDHKNALDKWRRLSLTKQNAIISRLCKAPGFLATLKALESDRSNKDKHSPRKDKHSPCKDKHSPCVVAKAIPVAIWT